MRTPVRAPKTNAIAERFVRTVRSECRDWLADRQPGHLKRVLRVYVEHYNAEHPHRSLGLRPPARPALGEIRRRDKLGGLSMSTIGPPRKARTE